MTRIILFVVVPLIVLLTACASVPPEVIELSYATGEDLAALQESYDQLIHDFFEQMRAQRITYLETRWTPMFIEKWVKNGRLIDVAKGKVIWDEDAADFVAPPSGGDEAALLRTVRTWADEAVYQIEAKKDELLQPLNVEEDSLRTLVNEAFRNVIRANAAITAHLNSIRDVHGAQDEVLEFFNIDNLRERINKMLAGASKRAEKGLVLIEEADGLSHREAFSSPE